MFFDTHCHLNFQIFDNDVSQVVNQAIGVGVKNIIIPGTDILTSKKSITIAQKFTGVYAAIGIHPHHIFEMFINKQNQDKDIFFQLERLVKKEKVVAVGEIGLDRHYYQKTKYDDYQINKEFINLQKKFFISQLKLAYNYKKSLIIHNRQAKDDLLTILKIYKKLLLPKKVVFHCCESDEELLDFAVKNKIFIGMDGDVFYDEKKQEFVKKIPLKSLVLETDAPFLSPVKKFPNQPKNLIMIAEKIAQIKKITLEKIAEKTTFNGKILFGLPPF